MRCVRDYGGVAREPFSLVSDAAERGGVGVKLLATLSASFSSCQSRPPDR
jgi:hypothetical protein